MRAEFLLKILWPLDISETWIRWYDLDVIQSSLCTIGFDSAFETLTTTIEDESLAGLLIALAIGDSTAISTTQWQTLSKIGTNNLFVISGLHIGLVGSLVYKVLGLLPLSIVARSASTLLLIGLYAALTGWGLPVQRVFVMAAVVVVARSLRRNVSATTMFCSALFAVLLIEPFAVLNIGFWLSFAAVFSLMFAFSCRRPLLNGVLASAIHAQWAVYLGMLPWMLYLLYQHSWSSFLVNIVAIPWIGIVVIPLLLMAMIVGFVLPAVGSIGIALCSKLLAVIWVGIEWAAGFDLVFFRSPPTELLLHLGLLAYWWFCHQKVYYPNGLVLSVCCRCSVKCHRYSPAFRFRLSM